MKNTIAVILAAGLGKRMNSSLPKVAHLLQDKPLIIWVCESLISADIHNLIPVISPTQDLVKEIVLKNPLMNKATVSFAYQDKQLGTAHAVQSAIKSVYSFFENNVPDDLKIIVAYGDTPAVKSDTFKKLIDYHNSQKNVFTILSFIAQNPFGYGRIIVDNENNFVAIREQKDCSFEEEKILVCNSGIICANFYELEKILPMIDNNNSAKEYYLTDIPLYAKNLGMKIGLLVENDELQFLGINTKEQLQDMEKRIYK